MTLVPFGKYKGQPVEVLAQDRPYLDWLSAQDWFRERYSGIYTLIVNNFAEAAETPDHNALQVLFLDDAFCERFVTVLNPRWRVSHVESLSNDMATLKRGIVERRASKYVGEEERHLLDSALGKYASAVRWEVAFGRRFEEGGIDVQLRAYIRTTEKPPHLEYYHQWRGDERHCYSREDHVRIEIKPTVSDDYPAVLRQMRANKSNVLFLETYTGAGATQEQFIKTFALSDIKVVFRHDVDAVQLTNVTP